MFGGHVFLREQSKIHHFNDLWALDTSTWEWLRLETPPEEPTPTPRDRASLVALPDGRLVLYGGADARARRLEDAWVVDPTAQIAAWRSGRVHGEGSGRKMAASPLPSHLLAPGFSPSPRLPTPPPPAAGAAPLSVASVPLSHWREIAAPPPHPKGRCCVAAARVGARVLFFGGDIGGASSDVWSLRVDPDPIDGAGGAAPGPSPRPARAASPSPGAGGVGLPGSAFASAPLGGGGHSSPSPSPPPGAPSSVTPPLLSLRPPLSGSGLLPGAPLPTPGAWTPLSLSGPSPPPLRGHAAAAAGRFVLIFGGVTEPRGLLGLKGRPEHSDVVAVLDRSPPGVRWREPIPTAPPPAAREKHTLTAVRDGRVLLFGGTDGNTTLGDAWWMRVDADDDHEPSPAEAGIPQPAVGGGYPDGPGGAPDMGGGGGGLAAVGAGASVAPVRPHGSHPMPPPAPSGPAVPPHLLFHGAAGTVPHRPSSSLLDDVSNPLIDLDGGGGRGRVDAAPTAQGTLPASGASGSLPPTPPPVPPSENDLAGLPPAATFNATYAPPSATAHHPRRLSLEQAFPATLAEWPAPAIEEQRRELERIQRERERGREERGDGPDFLTGEAPEAPEASVGGPGLGAPAASGGPGPGHGEITAPPPAPPPAPSSAPPSHAPSYAMTTLASGASSLLGALPAVPSNLSSAFGSLRGRLGLPAAPAGRAPAGGAAGEAAAPPPPLGALASAFDPALLALGERVWRRQRGGEATSSQPEAGKETSTTAETGAASAGVPSSSASLSSSSGAVSASAPPGAGPPSSSGPPPAPSRETLARTARQFLSTCEAREVCLGDLEALVADYRRWAVVGWRQALERGDAEVPPPLGRFLHVSAGDLRVRDVPDLLNEYRKLVAGITGGDA